MRSAPVVSLKALRLCARRHRKRRASNESSSLRRRHLDPWRLTLASRPKSPCSSFPRIRA